METVHGIDRARANALQASYEEKLGRLSPDLSCTGDIAEQGDEEGPSEFPLSH